MSSTIESTQSPHTILVVDDEELIRNLFARWLTARGYRVLQASDAFKALECLESNDIHLMTLDINMPGISGLELLSHVKVKSPELPVLMITASGQTKTAINAMSAGACGYLIKPVQQDELLVQVIKGLEWRELWMERQTYTLTLEGKVSEQTRDIRRAHEETIHRLVAATMCRDEETGTHIVRTGLFSEILARAAGWSSIEAEHIRFAAPMHDVGKVGIPDKILQKPGRLSVDEFEIMKTHTTIGASILAGSQSPILQLAQVIALNHHERWDGSGYPNGISNEAIPTAARIVSIVDVYDALTHDRIYRPAFPEATALAMMRDQQGIQFDPGLLVTFFTVLDEIHELAVENPDTPTDAPVQSFSSPLRAFSVPFSRELNV
ncbi:MAG TPA: HD domain-containing phosphohydrolase [Pirellula sp.]|nr:HD domain-containing phosphohydrolase [Pirellula sp.]